jgi:ribosome-associated toxin RatA of RatAB toxin-antitoxin module
MGLFNRTSRAEASLPCEASLVYEVLTDYDSYSEWLPMVTQSKLLAKEGDLALAEISVGQPFPDKLVFECIHDKNRSVLGRAISGKVPFGKLEWTISAEGAQSAKVSLVVASKSDWHWILPGWSKVIDAPAFLGALKGQVAAFGSELSVGAGGETILDLMDTPEGMVLVYRGQKYKLQPIE